jgi:hypothetical protein
MNTATATNEALVTPTVSLGTIARAMGPISPRALARLLHGHKYKNAGAIRSYQTARRQAVDFMVDGVPLDPSEPMREHEREAVRAMMLTQLVLPWGRAARPPKDAPKWVVDGVVISMQPDVELEGPRTAGAAKLSFTKEPLARGVGRTMASLLWHWRRNILTIEATSKDLCVVFEPRTGTVHRPGRQRTKTQIRELFLACKTIWSLWPTL